MSEITIRKQGRIGRITLTRPRALNALSHAMCTAIEAALNDWADDGTVEMVVVDAEGEKAFCAGGDLQEMYDHGRAGDYAYGQRFWRDEYRMNATIAEFPKPYAAFMQGFVMGGGVGVGCHGSHRVVGGSTRISMPEVSIGLVPDVGGTLLLSQAPGRLGEYLATTAARMEGADAIHAGFADYIIPETQWPELIDALALSGDLSLIEAAALPGPDSALAAQQAEIDSCFGGETLGQILRTLRGENTSFARQTLEILSRHAPLSLACAVEMIHRQRGSDDIRRALEREYRFTHRSFAQADFIEGIRAAIIDRDRAPKWKHADPDDLRAEDVAAMLRPLGDDALNLEKEMA
ncbi:3-hydroxyisobutyryl-CoA hydrolase [Brevirhabdus sp.]|uniref:3-hydroxyisobutyryl-CoA hydrolase n=1 Tax=Brevirhabdus sp. TaxID=2004514 RepID=UPI004059DBD1